MRALSAPRPARVVAAAVVAFVASSLVDAPVAAQANEWIPPVGGPVVRPFVAPIAEYAAGHRGVDFAAAVGIAVQASNDGTVTFAGSVAGALHVVVSHEGGIRTSYSFLSSIDVRVGQTVARGQVVGRTGGTGDGHTAGILHFGVRVGDRYVDPMLLFRPRDLTQVVRLVPAEELEAAELPDRPRDLQALARIVQDEGGGDGHDCSGVVGDVADVIGLGGEVEDACDALEEAVDTAWRALESLGEDAERFVDAFEGVVTDVIDRMRATGESLLEAADAVAGEAASAVAAVIEAAVDYAREAWEALTSCPQPTAKRRVRGSGNVAFAVGGFKSERRVEQDGTVRASFRFGARRLGYGPGEVRYASYSTTAHYTKRVSGQDLNVSARHLAEQLHAFARQHPLQPIDLIAHSQGGIVVYLFLADYYVGHEHEYPRVENVLTYASPLEGTPTTGLLHALNETPAAHVTEQFSARSLEQLQERSPLMTHVSHAAYPDDIRVLSIAGSGDLFIPSTSTDPPVEGEKVTVPTGNFLPFDDHSAVLDDDDALSAAQTFLSGGSPSDTCGPLVGLQGTVETAVVRSATRVLEVGGANSVLEGVTS